MIIIGADHAGQDLKKTIKEELNKLNIKFEDADLQIVKNDDDYPDVAKNISKIVLQSAENFGIAICGTGIGISVACNKIKGVRASTINTVEVAELSRKHNDLNIMCLGARLEYTKNIEEVMKIINAFITTKFEGERHIRRLNKINELENMLGN